MCIAGHGSSTHRPWLGAAPLPPPGTPRGSLPLLGPQQTRSFDPFPYHLLETNGLSLALAAIKPHCANALSLSGSDLMIIKWHI